MVPVRGLPLKAMANCCQVLDAIVDMQMALISERGPAPEPYVISNTTFAIIVMLSKCRSMDV